MKQLAILLCICAHALLIAQPGRAADTKQRPNIVLIMADDMGYECVGAYGGTSYKTPVLDRLAATGMRFDYCFSQPICTPSRVQLMTGIYNHRNYIRFGLLEPGAVTFAHVLKKAGYKTCVAGKWQLEGGFDGPHKFGFDEYCLWQLTRRPGRYPNPGLEINGKAVDYSDGEYGPDVVTDYICGFIDRHKDADAGPFFVYYPMILPHWPFEPTPDSDDWDPKAEGVLRGQGNNKYFADMVAYTDKMVGKVVAKLDEAGVRDNTIVLVTGDNGTARGITSMMGDRAVAGGKGMTTDAGTHVALIASWPGVVPAGAVNKDLVDFSDFLPTLAELARAEPPSGVRLDGRSFAPQLRGEKGDPRPWSYCWYERNGKRANAKQFARTHEWKLYDDGRFYLLAEDVLEQRPVALSSITDDKVRRTHAQLQAVLESMYKTARGRP